MRDSAQCICNGKLFAVLPCLTDDEILSLPDACAVAIDVEARNRELGQYSPVFEDTRLLILDFTPSFVCEHALLELGSTTPAQAQDKWLKAGDISALREHEYTATGNDMALNKLQLKIRLAGANNAFIRFEDDHERAIEFSLPLS